MDNNNCQLKNVDWGVQEQGKTRNLLLGGYYDYSIFE